MLNVLLTGSEGYIGQNFRKLYDKKLNIIECDYEINKPIENIEYNYDFKKIDRIIHFAAISGIINCEKDISQTIKDNVFMSEYLIKIAFENKIPLIFASSQSTKKPESSIYAFTKKIIEQKIKNYNKFDNNFISLRFANVYGGFNYLYKKTSAIANFINNYNNGKQLRVDGDGTQTRDFVHVYDICHCIYKIICELPKTKNPVDLGTGITTSINQIVNMITDNVRYESSRLSGAESSIANPKDIHDLIKIKPERIIEDYIKEQIN